MPRVEVAILHARASSENVPRLFLLLLDFFFRVLISSSLYITQNVDFDVGADGNEARMQILPVSENIFSVFNTIWSITVG